MLKQQIQDDMKAAMKGGDKPRLGVIRLILAAIKQKEVDDRIELNDEHVLAILDKTSEYPPKLIVSSDDKNEENIEVTSRKKLVKIKKDCLIIL